MSDSTPSLDARDDAPEVVVHSASMGRLQSSVLNTRTLMTVAACGVVGALIVVPLTYLSAAIAVTPGGILAVCVIMGVWAFPYLLAGVVTHKPGAVVIASLIIGIISTFTTPLGPSAILGNLIGGLLLETPLAVLLYRQWNWIGYGLGALCFGAFNGAMYTSYIQVAAATWQVLGFVAVAVASCFVVVALMVLLERRLRRAGIGSGTSSLTD